MFPIAHAWLLEQLVPAPMPAHYLGCVWPDMLIGSPLTHAQSHQQGAALAAYARTLPDDAAGDEFRAFVAGALTHGSTPHGFDWYSDEEYAGGPRGYAFQHGKPLADETARACHVPESAGWWKAHNIVEMAFETPLYLAQPHLGDRLTAACADVALHARLAALLAAHYGAPTAALAESMRVWTDYVDLRPATLAALARIYARQVAAKHDGAQADIPAIEQLIARAQTSIAADRDTYLAASVAGVGAMLRETLG